ncbi:MAG: hypothetical protein WCK63_17915, partial [Betaproteobacteria bacterium]
FFSPFNARSSMVDKKLLVAQAGALTRRLVLACWPWRIGREDCACDGPSRSPLTCNDLGAGYTACAACYGHLTALGGPPPKGFPVGLVAAQSIGERGTQLSMQSFHTGVRAITPRMVTDLFERRGKWKGSMVFDDLAGFSEFVMWIKGNISAFKDLDEIHLKMVWLAIHRSSGKTLTSAWTDSAGSIGRLAGTDQLKSLIAGIGTSDDLMHPVVRVMAGSM